MEDVHMEDAGVAVEAGSTLNASSSSPSTHSQNLSPQQQDSKDAINANVDNAVVSQSGDQATTITSQTESDVSTPATASITTNSLTANDSNLHETKQSSAANESSTMDVDASMPVDEVKNEPKDIQQADNDNSGSSHSKALDTVTSEPKEQEREKVEVTATAESSATAQASLSSDQLQPNGIDGAKGNQLDNSTASTDAQAVKGQGEETQPTELSATATPAPQPQPQPQLLRSYIPQFKFTTFTAMTPLPTRNVTSNFLRTEKNFVLKEMATKRKRRKRKVEDNTNVEEGKGTEGEIEGEEKPKGDEGVVLKKAKNDEFSAIRRGIFAEDNDEEDKDRSDNEDGDDDQKREDDDEYEYSSESDSEASIVNETDENGETKSSSDAGKKIIVIHPGSRILRIGRASDAYPVATPHCIARRMHVKATVAANGKQSSVTTTAPGSSEDAATTATANGVETSTEASTEEALPSTVEGDNVDVEDENAMDVDGDDDAPDSEVPDIVNDRYLQEIEYDLKLRMKAAKRRPVPNAKTQVRSFNTSTRPERILDHNDPYKVEWTDPASEGEYIIGQKALNLPPSKNHSFKLFWPVLGGKLNDQDYTTPRVVVSDLETIWTKVIQEDLGIEPNKFRKHYALLVIPDLYNKLYVIELVNMLLRSMQFRGVMVQQESVCASFGAGVSAACVVDIGAEVTKVACVEDGICIPNSRAVLKYGGDDITRCFTALVKRTGFPYQELDLAQTYDWRLMEELKEKWCTMNEADLTVQVYNFFVRRPEKQTEKYQVKVYDEVALSPMCLFFPGVIRRWIEEREINPTFAKITNYEDINEDAPPISLTNQSQKKSSAAAAIAAAARAGTPSLMVPGEENNTNTNGNATPSVGTPGATPVPTPTPSAVPTTPAASAAILAPTVIPFAMEPSVTTTDKSWEIAGTIGKDHFSSLVALDVVVAQSISNCGSEERSKKLYGSIILVGGGGMIKGFDRVLEDRLFQALPATLTTVEKVEVLPSPRDMDPRLLVWKGASVLGKLETAKELWIKPLEWELMGRKILRDKALFVWSKE
ncbi:actin-like protein arp8 [Entomortierella chlamydospora]|uniref:Actin-like protein arp8 n=1 Tax=Entomortierella chlamydospora TaxID=101097 RepID=A0A9P6N4B2_9FUNG|nr:actin-like protein arp8 [Entomortierella chlamydospora]